MTRISRNIALAFAAFLLTFGGIMPTDRPHPLTINGHSFGNAVEVNGVWAVSVEDFQKNLDGAFTVAGNRLMIVSPRNVATGQAVGRRIHKPVRVVTPTSAPLLTSSGKQYIALSDVAKLFGSTFTAPATVAGGLNLNFPRIHSASIDWGD
ncbi:MAG TPA: hypothetical protein VJ853_07350 [Thermoanaerobaculia bacterium]|nr:hypothetical protein [Thermoanaerobaculia bacterium]